MEKLIKADKTYYCGTCGGKINPTDLYYLKRYTKDVTNKKLIRTKNRQCVSCHKLKEEITIR